MLVFGYGSLMNNQSVARTSATADIYDWYSLPGYQRKCNAIHEDFPDVAMNIIKNTHHVVEGRVIRFPESDIPALKKRELGYELIDITNQLEHDFNEQIFTFIAPDVSEYGDKYVKQSYVDICLAAVPKDKRERWLLETIVECQIKEI